MVESHTPPGTSDTRNLPQSDVIRNGVKILGETVVLPGASLILEGKIAEGAIHAVLGLAVRAMLGPAWLLIAANSYSKSISGKNLYEDFLK